MGNNIKSKCVTISGNVNDIKRYTIEYIKSLGNNSPTLSGTFLVKTYLGEKPMNYNYLFRQIDNSTVAIYTKLDITSYSGFDYYSFFRNYEKFLTDKTGENCQFCNFTESDFPTEDYEAGIPDDSVFDEAIRNLQNAYKALKKGEISEDDYNFIYDKEIKRI